MAAPAKMEDRHLPRPTTTLLVDIRGAEIVDEVDAAPETSDIYLPKYTEYISHIAVDVSSLSLCPRLNSC